MRVRRIDDILLLTIIIALVFGAIGVSMPLLTLYLQSLGADYAHIALILATTAAVGLGSSYLWGRVTDALGRRKPLIAAGLAVTGVAYLLLSRVTTPGLAWLVRLGEAASMAAYNTASLALMGDLLAARDRRGQRMGTYRGIGSLAFAGGALIGGRLADAYSLRLILVVSALLYASGGLMAMILREVPVRRMAGGDEGTPVPQASRPASEPRFSLSAMRSWRPGLPLLFLGGVFLWTTAWNAQASMWPNYMAAQGYDKTAISSLWGLAGLIEAPSMRLAGQWSDLIGREALLATSGLGAAVVLLGYIIFSRLLPALFGIQFVRGLTFGSYTANAMTFAVESGDDQARGRNSGLFNTMSSAGNLAGLLLGGTVAQAGGFALMFGVCAIAALLGGACFLGLRWRRTHTRRLAREVS